MGCVMQGRAPCPATDPFLLARADARLAAFARDLGQMIILRGFQGFTGGVLIPMSFTLVLTRLPKSQQPVGLALFALTATFAPATANSSSIIAVPFEIGLGLSRRGIQRRLDSHLSCHGLVDPLRDELSDGIKLG